MLELSISYALKKAWFITPTVSALVGRQWGGLNQGGLDYTYWNASVILFNESPAFSFDIR